MGKAIDRLIDLLPVPLLISFVVVAACAWAIKEYRNLPTNGDVLRDTWFQVACVIVLAGVAAFYASTAILAHSGPQFFSEKERGIYVARFEGDSDNKVQLQAFESLKDAIPQAGALTDVRVVKYPDILKDTNSAIEVLKKSRARVVIWGSFVPPERVHVSIATYPEGGETRQPIDKFPDVSPLTSKILDFLQLTPPPAGAKPEDQISFLNKRIESLEQQIQRPPANLAVLKPTTSTEPHHLRVLSIGVERYTALQYPSLRYAVADSTALAEVIKEHAPESTVAVLSNPTKQDVLSALDKLRQDAREEDTVLIYWTGVGARSGNTSFLVPTDGAAGGDNLSVTTTWVPLSELLDWAHNVPARRVVFLVDSAFVSVEVRELGRPGQFVAFMSSAGSDEPSFESPKLGHSVFTYAVVKALSGEADYNGDGLITAEELFAYVRVHVPALSTQLGFPQHPSLYTSEATQSVVLVRLKPQTAATKELQNMVGSLPPNMPKTGTHEAHE